VTCLRNTVDAPTLLGFLINREHRIVVDLGKLFDEELSTILVDDFNGIIDGEARFDDIELLYGTKEHNQNETKQFRFTLHGNEGGNSSSRILSEENETVIFATSEWWDNVRF
jgi:hypothetical protein